MFWFFIRSINILLYENFPRNVLRNWNLRISIPFFFFVCAVVAYRYSGAVVWRCYLSLQTFRPANNIGKRHQHRCFPVKFAKFLRTLFFTEHLRWLLLDNVVLSTLWQISEVLQNSMTAFWTTSSLQLFF